MANSRPVPSLTIGEILPLLSDESNAAGLTPREAVLVRSAINARIFTEASLAQRLGIASAGVMASLSRACQKIAAHLNVEQELVNWIDERKLTLGGFYQNLLFVTAKDFDGGEYASGHRIFTLHPDMAIEIIEA